MIDFNQVELENDILTSLDRFHEEYGSEETVELIKDWLTDKMFGLTIEEEGK